MAAGAAGERAGLGVTASLLAVFLLAAPPVEESSGPDVIQSGGFAVLSAITGLVGGVLIGGRECDSDYNDACDKYYNRVSVTLGIAGLTLGGPLALAIYNEVSGTGGSSGLSLAGSIIGLLAGVGIIAIDPNSFESSAIILPLLCPPLAATAFNYWGASDGPTPVVAPTGDGGMTFGFSGRF